MQPRAKQSPPLQGFFFHPPFSQNFWPDILDEIYKKKVYEKYLLGKTDLLIADWGSNVGLSAYYFKDYASRVFAVEPSAQHIESIRAMIKQNGIKNIEICPYAIANKNGTTKFYHNENQTMFSLNAVVDQEKGDFEEVETVSVDEFFKRNKIDHLDLLKFDCEGEESKIINSEGFKKYADKIKVIVGEWHNWTDSNQAMFQRTFEDLGFDFHWRHDTQASVFEAVRR